MAVYLILLLIPLAIQHCVVGDRQVDYERRNKFALIFFFVFLTILIMLRHASVGNDTQNYIKYFKGYSNLSWIQVGRVSGEFGLSYYNKFVSVFTKDPQVFLAITAIITSAMIYPTYRRLNLDPALTIVLYCTMSTFVMMFSGIGQMLAIGIGFVAYEFTRKKKLIPFIICVILAVTFHTSAFMIAFMYPLYYAKITKKWLLVVVPVLAVIFVFNRQFFGILAFVMETFTEYDGSIVETGAYTMLFLFAIFAVFAFLIPDDSLADEETVGLRNFLLFSLVIQMFAPLHSLAMRMSYYYIIFIPLLIPKIIEYKSDRWKNVAVIARHVMVCFFFVYFFYNAYLCLNNEALRSSNLHVFPYHFFWETV